MNDTITALETEALEMAEMLPGLVVDDDASYRQAAEVLVEIKTRLGTIEDERKKITGPLYQAYKASNDLFSRLAEKYTLGERAVKLRIAAYDEQRRAEEARLLKQASEEDDRVTLELVALAAPTATGVSTRQVRDYEIVDVNAIPDDYWMVDETKLKKAVKAGITVPGVRVFKKTQVAASRRMSG